MRRAFVMLFLSLLVGACASAKKAPFDASADERVGREVAKACLPDAGLRHGGGYLRVGNYDAYVTGSTKRQFLLVFSGGCGDLRPGGGFAIFQDYGPPARRACSHRIGWAGGFRRLHHQKYLRMGPAQS